MTGISKAIDPARVGLSKSLMTTPCARKGWFSENIRDAGGSRIEHPMPENVTFGTAVDEAHAYIVESERAGLPWSLDDAVDLGIHKASRRDGSWALVTDRETFGIQVATAMRKFVNEPDGLARLAPHIPGIRIQGDNGRSLRIKNADGETEVVGTPDYWLRDDSILDVKTSGKRFTDAKFWTSVEMGVYSMLVKHETGRIPPRLIYQVYVTTAKPYWMWLEVPGSDDFVEIGRDAAATWRLIVDAPDPQAIPPNTMFCGGCPWAAPLPDLGFEGCSVGRRMPRVEEAAA